MICRTLLWLPSSSIPSSTHLGISTTTTSNVTRHNPGSRSTRSNASSNRHHSSAFRIKPSKWQTSTTRTTYAWLHHQSSGSRRISSTSLSLDCHRTFAMSPGSMQTSSSMWVLSSPLPFSLCSRHLCRILDGHIWLSMLWSDIQSFRCSNCPTF